MSCWPANAACGKILERRRRTYGEGIVGLCSRPVECVVNRPFQLAGQSAFDQTGPQAIALVAQAIGIFVVERRDFAIEIGHFAQKLLIRVGRDDKARRHGKLGRGERDEVAALATDQRADAASRFSKKTIVVMPPAPGVDFANRVFHGALLVHFVWIVFCIPESTSGSPSTCAASWRMRSMIAVPSAASSRCRSGCQ